MPVGDKVTPQVLVNKNLYYSEYIEKLPGVYPLTGKELLQFAKDAAEASIKMSPEQFLKSKGVEI